MLEDFMDGECIAPKKVDWTREWVGMPEFNQEKIEPFKELTIRFASQSDYDSFSELIGQKLTLKTKSLWHPQLERGQYNHLRYVEQA